MSASLVRKVRLRVASGNAKPGPAIGQALGPLGLNMADFCKQFNDRTKDYIKNIDLPVTLSAFSNRTFEFEVKTPPTSWYLKKCAGIEKGANSPGHENAGSVHVKQLYEIALAKKKDVNLQHLPEESIVRSIIGQCSSMGITVQGMDYVPEEKEAASEEGPEAVKA